MNNTLNYINSNAIVASLIGIVIAWLLSTFTSICISNKERKDRLKEESNREKRKQYENKAELRIEKYMWDNSTIPNIKLFMTDFKVDISKDKKEISFLYNKNTLNRKKYKHLKFYIKNIGNADINQLDVCVCSQKNNMLVDIEHLDSIVKNNWINYNFCYDRKILKNEFILIDIAFLDDSKIFSSTSSELVLLYKDSYNNLYEQPFFLEESNLYEPTKITFKDYRSHVTTDLAIDCFKRSLW